MFILVSKITYAVQYFCDFKSHEMILTKDKVRKKKYFSLNITFRHTFCVTWLVFYWKKYFHIGGSPYSEIWNIKTKKHNSDRRQTKQLCIYYYLWSHVRFAFDMKMLIKGNNKITELRAILQRESQNS